MKTVETLQKIQNEALRRILKVPKATRIEELHSRTGIEPISDRLRSLGLTYLKESIARENPILTDLIVEYRSFIGARAPVKKYILCHYKNEIDQVMTRQHNHQ